MPRIVAIALLLALTSLLGCKSPKPHYARPLPAGASALVKLEPGEWPDLRFALPMDDAFVAATRRSLAWFDKPSSQGHFPINGITHDQARASLYALPQLAWEGKTTDAFLVRMREEFDVYSSVGWDGTGTLLFTGYYSPIFNASKVRTAEYRFPLYKRPADLVSDPKTGEVSGRSINGRVEQYPPRSHIENSNMLAGQELVFLRSRLDAYIVEVQGSARLTMTDGTSMLVGFAGTNGLPYTSIGRLLGEEEKIDPDAISLPVIREYFARNPQELDRYIQRNDRFVFFKEYDETDWPSGSLGFKVESVRTLATDKSIYPRGCVTLVETNAATGAGTRGGAQVVAPGADAGGFFSFMNKSSRPKVPEDFQPFRQLMLDQDTGGAIRAPGRADIYFGIGPEAETLAELALRFTLHHPAVSTVIPGMRSTKHVAANISYSDGRCLSPEMLARLKQFAWDRAGDW